MLISGAIILIVMAAVWVGLVITGGKFIKNGAQDGWPD